VTPSAPKNAITSRRVGEALWRQKLVCALVFLVILAVGGGVILTRATTYQSHSSVALLPPPKKPTILPNYPNIIISLVPTYVQLVSSPVLLDEVAPKLPFNITPTKLAADLHAEAMSNAAIINIIAQSPDPAQAREIAAVATQTFLAHVSGNGVVVPRVYGQPTAPQPAPPSKKLLLPVVVILAAILAASAGLIWDHFAAAASRPGGPTGAARRAPMPENRAEPDRVRSTPERAAPTVSGAVRPVEPFETVKLRPPAQMADGPDGPGESSRSRMQAENGKTDEIL
jgi:capsular polysaccharide biosynthesis protein